MSTVTEIIDFMHEQIYPNCNRKMAAKIIDLLVNQHDSYIFALKSSTFSVRAALWILYNRQDSV
jgi:hypothetical protein